MSILKRIIAFLIGKPGTHWLRRLVNVVAAVVLLPWLLLAIGTAIAMMVNGSKHATERNELRALHKVRIGESEATVRQKLGAPSEIVPNPAEGVTAWGYANADTGTSWVMLTTTSEGGRVSLIEFAPSKAPLWPPEDGQAPSQWEIVNQTLLDFRHGFGEPCDSAAGAAPGQMAYYYPLTMRELKEDPYYNDLVQRSAPQPRVARYLTVQLGPKGHVLGSGWASITEANRCYAVAGMKRP